jgi:hypothetical protein
MNSDKAYNLHVEHQQWLENLRFYEDELAFLKRKLAELLVRNNSEDVRIEIERYQNQVIIQKNEIDELRHSIKEHETYIERNLKPGNEKTFYDHSKERDRMETFEKLFKEMKNAFTRFMMRAA